MNYVSKLIAYLKEHLILLSHRIIDDIRQKKQCGSKATIVIKFKNYKHCVTLDNNHVERKILTMMKSWWLLSITTIFIIILVVGMSRAVMSPAYIARCDWCCACTASWFHASCINLINKDDGELDDGSVHCAYTKTLKYKTKLARGNIQRLNHYYFSLMFEMNYEWIQLLNWK